MKTKSKVKSNKGTYGGQGLVFTFAFLLLPFAFACTNLDRRLFPTPSAEELQREVERLGDVPVAANGAAPVSPGSLWPRDDHVFFYGDVKARRVGDILTVRIVEAAEASNAADTDLSRKSSINAKVDSFLGAKRFLGFSPLSQPVVESSADNGHVGKGTTTREGKVTANITTVVTQVLPNGNLVIKGTRTVGVNHEEQLITLTGIVRQEDLARDNSVLSTQIADAHITLSGAGVVADKQRSGWGTWVFDWLWPF
ncbi:MAG TPA: flagellar basal body L-ring protein FlgH [Candidatus Binatia bacterium]|jgi:flagellar L-ring protein precursor FlgH